MPCVFICCSSCRPFCQCLELASQVYDLHFQVWTFKTVSNRRLPIMRCLELSAQRLDFALGPLGFQHIFSQLYLAFLQLLSRVRKLLFPNLGFLPKKIPFKGCFLPLFIDSRSVRGECLTVCAHLLRGFA